MNGRVYDYNLGRFLSVDPVIQEPGNSQSMNPYSYIMNNPLSGTDPSGYSSEKEIKVKVNVTTTTTTSHVNSRIKRTETTTSEETVTATVTADSNGKVTGVHFTGGSSAGQAGAAGALGGAMDIGAQPGTNGSNASQPGGSDSVRDYYTNTLTGPEGGAGGTFGAIAPVEGNVIAGGLKFLAMETTLGVAYGEHSRWRADVESQADIDAFVNAGGPVGQALIFLAGMRKDLAEESAEFLAKHISETTKLAERVSDSFKCNGMCKEFAGDLQKKMKAAGINGQRLDMETGTGLIYSNKNKVISTNGTHSAIKVGDTVFDNLNPKGVKHNDWIDDLGGKEFTKPPHALIKSTDF